MRIDLTLSSGRRVAFEITLGLDGPAYFAMSVRKCGSTFFNQLCQKLACANGRNFVPVGDTFFWNNVVAREFVNDASLPELVQPQNVYGGFRDMPSALLASDLFRTGPKLFMIRDLRDALVSEYFSNAFSHPVPDENSSGNQVRQLLLQQRHLALCHDIDNAVIQQSRAMRQSVLNFAPILELEHTTVLKYEDYVFNKRALVDKITDTFGWTIGEDQARQMASSADIRPEKEDPRAFVRRVTPGDHREKLRPETIEKLNVMVGPVMELFGYTV